MSDPYFLNVAVSLVATLFGLLILILGWLGNKFYSKMDEISKNLVTMAGELHTRINGHDRRITVLETRIDSARRAP